MVNFAGIVTEIIIVQIFFGSVQVGHEIRIVCVVLAQAFDVDPRIQD